MKVIVVGTNHAGTTAVRTIRRQDPNAEIVTYDKNDNISFLGCGIALWVADEIDNADGLFYANPDVLKKENIKVNMEHEVTNIDPIKKEIKVKNLKTNKELTDTYDKLILAVGSWPIVPPSIEGLTGEGKLANIELVKLYQHGAIVKKANNDKKIKKVVVCGAGYIGIELVDAFAKSGKDVTLIDIVDRIMPRYYDKPFTDLVEKGMADKGVKFAGGSTVKKFKGKNGKVTHVITDNGEFEADLVIWAVGFRPATAWLKGVVDQSPIGAIVVNEYMQTSNKDIYAVGDCIEVFDNAKKDSAYLALATTAVRSGIIAATNVVKENSLKSLGFQGSNAINVFDWCLASTGMTESVCIERKVDYELTTFSDADKPEFMHDNNPVTLRIVWNKKDRKIIGAQVASQTNHTEVMYMFSLAILKGLTIDELPLLDIFFLPHFNKPYNFITMAGLEVLGLNYFKK
ncbi:FAD-dependent oxidoreductase [Spiroplasma endosymbiont of Anurida maritima]|uniref:FAD-dependent oxidoreductase n=1 Tax=Spiroplasma endosymbiont of Anurida maritima TaxID=2967972 RepID=UPI0036D32791